MTTTQPEMVAMTFPGTDTRILVPTSFGYPIVTEEELVDYKRELDLLKKKKPIFATLVLGAMWAGKVRGDNYVFGYEGENDQPDCGCIYGHSAELNFEAACDLVHEVRTDLFENITTQTYLEGLIVLVEEGDTPDPVHCPQLYVLEQILKLYVEEGAA